MAEKNRSRLFFKITGDLLQRIGKTGRSENVQLGSETLRDREEKERKEKSFHSRLSPANGQSTSTSFPFASRRFACKLKGDSDAACC